MFENAVARRVRTKLNLREYLCVEVAHLEHQRDTADKQGVGDRLTLALDPLSFAKAG